MVHQVQRENCSSKVSQAAPVNRKVNRDGQEIPVGIEQAAVIEADPDLKVIQARLEAGLGKPS